MVAVDEEAEHIGTCREEYKRKKEKELARARVASLRSRDKRNVELEPEIFKTPVDKLAVKSDTVCCG